MTPRTLRLVPALGFAWLAGCGVSGTDAPGVVRGEVTARMPPSRPHVVFVVADDLGWRDVGYHSSEILTPHIDRLSEGGVRLECHYVLPVCSPTRASLLTGRYPIRTGLQSGVIRPWSSHGLPLEERTLPQALHEAGYRTAMVGKWHLGHSRAEYLPTRRGFDSQYGHYNGAIDYFTHERDGGLDWHRDDRPLREEGYSTRLIGREAVRVIDGHDPSTPLFLYVAFNAPHAPLQAPADYLQRYASIADEKRRTFAAMVSCLDDAVGGIAEALDRRGMAPDTLLVFTSDNGGPRALGADNGYLRAGKGTLYEGGVRVCAWAAWPGRIPSGTVVSEPIHAVDWYPTILRLAGVSLARESRLDGRDILPVLAQGKPSPHPEILLNVEEGRGSIRREAWKLVARGKLPHLPGDAAPELELFDLRVDAGETTNLATLRPDVAGDLLRRLDEYAREASPALGGARENRPPQGYEAPAVWGQGG